MKRKVFSVLLIAAMTATLAGGCGGKEKGDADGGSGKGKTVKLQFMHQQVEQERQEVVKKLIDGFEAENKGIQIEPIPVNEDDYDSKIAALGGSGELPAIIEYSQDQAKTSVANQFTSLDAVKSVIDKKGEAAFYDGALQVTKTEDGKGYVGVPLCSWVQGIWVNTAMLKEKGFDVPKTWDDVLAIAKAFYDPADKKYGIALPTSESTFTEQAFSQFALSNEANVFDKDKNVTVDTPEMKEALEYYKELASYSMPGSTEVADVKDAFVGKNAPMAMYSTYILGTVDEAGFAKDLALVLPNKKKAVAYGTITVLGIADGMDKAHTEAAEKFVSYLLEKKNNITWLNMAPGGIQPVLKEVSDDPAFTDMDARKVYAGLNDDIASAVENLQMFGTVDGKNFTEMGDVTNKGIISKMVNQVVVQKADVDKELKTAQAAVKNMTK